MNRRIVHAASLAALLFALVLVPAAVAGKGKGQGNNPTDPTLFSDCNPCAVSTFAHFSGSGYDGSQPRALVAFRSSDGSITQTGANVNSDGTLAFDVYMAPAGAYDVMILQDDHNKTVLKAELDGLVVQ